MKGLKPSTREAVIWVARHYPSDTFRTSDIPEEHRQGITGMVGRSYIRQTARVGQKEREYTMNAYGMTSARRFTGEEL